MSGSKKGSGSKKSRGGDSDFAEYTAEMEEEMDAVLAKVAESRKNKR